MFLSNSNMRCVTSHVQTIFQPILKCKTSLCIDLWFESRSSDLSYSRLRMQPISCKAKEFCNASMKEHFYGVYHDINKTPSIHHQDTGGRNPKQGANSAHEVCDNYSTKYPCGKFISLHCKCQLHCLHERLQPASYSIL